MQPMRFWQNQNAKNSRFSARNEITHPISSGASNNRNGHHRPIETPPTSQGAAPGGKRKIRVGISKNGHTEIRLLIPAQQASRIGDSRPGAFMEAS
jgi:hypothetical protein